MKIVTWNVNSLKVRLPRVLEFLAQHEPDVVLMQETKIEEKLAFLDAAAKRVAELREGGAMLVGGDFNVAPADLDVYDPLAFVGSTHVTDEERSRIAALIAAGEVVDSYRHLHPDTVQYTWWDYRQGHFHRGMGLRIDLLLASESLASSIEACGIERDYRKGPKPSDHAPLMLEMKN